LVIRCRGRARHTQLCLDAVLRHTRTPYEVLLVEEGEHATAALPEEVLGRPAPERIEVIRGGPGRAPGAGLGQALALARGRYLVFLDDDVVVTEGWLGCLVKCVLHQWPDVGLVGPVSNGAGPPQQARGDYGDLAALPAFAARRRREYRGRAAPAEHLEPFCMLARREVLERLGGAEAVAGLDDVAGAALSRRAREAGFRLLVTQDVFVHRFGPRAPAPASGGPHPEPARARQRVTLCVITRDDETGLERCLRSAADLVEEIVVVDAGSADQTRQVAGRWGARVFDFAWGESFAAARNQGLSHARGDWVFWLDADEWLDDDNRRRLQTLFASLKPEKQAYLMRQLSPVADGREVTLTVDQVRLFPRDPAVGWEYRVHEQVLPSLRRAGYALRLTDVVIRHGGFQDGPRARARLERDLELLRMQQAEQPDDPVVLGHMGLALGQAGRMEEALPLLRRSLELAAPDGFLRAKVHALLCWGHQRLGQRAEALTACRAGRRECPDDVELLFLEGLLLRDEGDQSGAEAALRRLLRLPRQPQLARLDTGLHGYKARHLLGALYREQGRWPEAEAQWRAAVAEEPRFAPAWQDLAELWLAGRNWAELERAAAGLAPAAPLEAELVRARGLLARGDYAGVRALLEPLVEQATTAVKPRLLLARALILEGREWDAAENLLREVLSLDPNEPEARESLALVWQGQQRAAEEPPMTFLARPRHATLERLVEGIQDLGGTVEVGRGEPGKPSLRIDLHGTGAPDAALASLRGQAGLEALYLGLTPVGDAGLECLRDLPDLRILALNGTKVTDAGLAHLRGLASLRVLALGGTDVTDAGLAHLAGLTQLQELFLNGTKVTDAGLAHFRGLQRLRRLDLLGTRITDAGLAALEGLTELEQLDLSATAVGDAGLVSLEGLAGLRALSLNHTRTTDGGLGRVARWGSLRLLEVGGTSITDAGLEHVARLQGLLHLSLHQTEVGHGGLARLEGLTGLQTLRLGSTRVSNAGLAVLRGLTALRTLDLEHTAVSDDGLGQLSGLPGLQELDLAGTRISDGGLGHLAALGDLRSLNLSQTGIGDAALSCLSGLVALRELDLSRTRVGDAGVAQLAALSALESLNLWQTRVSDAGLAQLKGLGRLRRLAVGQCPVSGAAIEALRQALPRLQVERESLEEALWWGLEKLLTAVRLLPLPDRETMARRLDGDPQLVHRPLNEHTADLPLHYAAAQGRQDLVELLLARGADVHIRGARGRTALHHAARSGSEDVARLLLERGAEPGATDEDGETPLAAAAHCERAGVAALLEQHGARADLNSAVRLGHARRVREWLDDDPNAWRGARSPQDLLADVIDYLIAREIARRGGGDDAARVEAVLEERRPLVETLLAQGADPNAGNALYQAVRLPDPSIARLLLEHGADPDRGGWLGLPLLEFAQGEPMRELLREFQAGRRPDTAGAGPGEGQTATPQPPRPSEAAAPPEEGPGGSSRVPNA
jgi:ankyrin repeat protein/glycosyltransferase involved in cell wall biosynthesis/tetratricopeptide (TPR) repeat protein/Leucine-rich repeat (LRR) protein